jgi:hypothetical protein
MLKQLSHYILLLSFHFPSLPLPFPNFSKIMSSSNNTTPQLVPLKEFQRGYLVRAMKRHLGTIKSTNGEGRTVETLPRLSSEAKDVILVATELYINKVLKTIQSAREVTKRVCVTPAMVTAAFAQHGMTVIPIQCTGVRRKNLARTRVGA